MLGPRYAAPAGACGGGAPAAAQQERQLQQQGSEQPAQRAQHAQRMPLSYVATVYTLLHELDLVEVAIKRRPELWEAASLAEVQRALWGALDEE